jgi:LDH2 family malate/lactate/ureidoglycolate dehydrogenase
MVAVRPDLVGEADRFRSEVTRIIADSRKLQPLPGLQTTEVAGSLEWQRERDWSLEGIPIARAHREALEGLARDLSLKVPW